MNGTLARRLDKLETDHLPAVIELTLIISTDDESLLAKSPEVSGGMTTIYKRANEVTP